MRRHAKGKQIVMHFHDCKWCCTCTRRKPSSNKILLQAGYQNSGLCDHVMYTGIYMGGMIRPTDEEDTPRVNKTRGAKKKTNCYSKPPDVPPPTKKPRMSFTMFR